MKTPENDFVIYAASMITLASMRATMGKDHFGKLIEIIQKQPGNVGAVAEFITSKEVQDHVTSSLSKELTGFFTQAPSELDEFALLHESVGPFVPN